MVSRNMIRIKNIHITLYVKKMTIMFPSEAGKQGLLSTLDVTNPNTCIPTMNYMLTGGPNMYDTYQKSIIMMMSLK